MQRVIGFILIAVAFIAMLAWTWGRWCDPLVDFGRELYVPRQLASGGVLYRDVAHLNGPLSQYFNALLFKIFGPSLRTLVFANIAIAVGVIVMLWTLFRAIFGAFAATAASLLFVLLFMAIQLVQIGNYNWITPYSHELTHGIALSLLGLVGLKSYLAKQSVKLAGIIGACAGMVFLTKPEVFIAAAPALAIGVWVGAGKDAKTQAAAAFVAGMMMPVLASIVLLSPRGTFGAWMFIFDSRMSGMAFYRKSMGFDQPATNIGRAMLQAGICIALFLPAIAIDRKFAGRKSVAVIYAIVLLAILCIALPWQRVADSFRGVLPLMIGAGVLARRRGALAICMSIFATLLLLKIALAVRIFQYGFALAMPAMLMVAATIISSRGAMRWAGATLLGYVCAAHLFAYSTLYHDKPSVVARGSSDEFRTDERGELVNQILERLRQLPDGATVAVVPQGVMIDFLATRQNSTRYFTLMPPEVTAFGDDQIASAYTLHPPDFVVVIPEPFGEYGFSSFEAFAPQTAAFIRANYSPISMIHFGDRNVALLQHNQ